MTFGNFDWFHRHWHWQSARPCNDSEFVNLNSSNVTKIDISLDFCNGWSATQTIWYCQSSGISNQRGITPRQAQSRLKFRCQSNISTPLSIFKLVISFFKVRGPGFLFLFFCFLCLSLISCSSLIEVRRSRVFSLKSLIYLVLNHKSYIFFWNTNVTFV